MDDDLRRIIENHKRISTKVMIENIRKSLPKETKLNKYFILGLSLCMVERGLKNKRR